MTDKTLQDPANIELFVKSETPVAESKYIVRVKAKELGWQNFDIFGNDLRIFPAHVLKTMDGAAYLRDYNFKLLPGSGPYIVKPEDVIKGKSVSLAPPERLLGGEVSRQCRVSTISMRFDMSWFATSISFLNCSRRANSTLTMSIVPRHGSRN